MVVRGREGCVGTLGRVSVLGSGVESEPSLESESESGRLVWMSQSVACYETPCPVCHYCSAHPSVERCISMFPHNVV